MKDQRTLSKKESLSNLTAPHDFRPGSDEKIALLRKRAEHGKPLFVAGEPHVYMSPETGLTGFLQPQSASSEQVEDTALPQQTGTGKRSRAGASFSRSTRVAKSHARTEREERKNEIVTPDYRSWGSEELVIPKTEPIRGDVLIALQLLAQSPNSAITGANEMLAEIQGKQEEHENQPAILPAA